MYILNYRKVKIKLYNALKITNYKSNVEAIMVKTMYVFQSENFYKMPTGSIVVLTSFPVLDTYSFICR